MGGFKPRAPPEGLLVAEGLGWDPVEDTDVDEEEVELAPVALSLKAWYVLSGVGLTAKTIPALQWAPCLQKNHKGTLAFETVKLHSGTMVALAATG